MVGKKAVGKYTKKQVKKMADDIFGTDKAIKNIGKPGGTKKFKGKGIDKVKKDLKPKTVKRSEAPIQSERSKITAANKTAANQRAKTAGKTAGVSATRNTTNKVLPVGSKRATALGLGASAAAIGTLNKKKPAAKKETFADAFRKARAKGEGTKFTHNGKKYTAVTKTDLKKKGFDSNELAAYNKRGGKARGPLNRLGQKAKKVLLGKDKKFGGDKGAIDFIRKPKKKMDGGMMNKPVKKMGGGMMSKPVKKMGGGMMKYKAGGMATKGLGKAFKNSKR